MNRELIEALNLVEKEKGISKEVLIEAIESALSSAYKKDQRGNSNIKVELNPETGDFHIYAYKEVVIEVEDETSEINLAEAKSKDPLYNEGDMVEF
ncbi:MAG TPA: transcription termination/antitermination protein NusA, partial [Firmicutes bacterium]|nr:transcription termination/antitermination protein NusA [Bacillota bacterium]